MTEQLTDEDLKSMNWRQIERARHDGRLAGLGVGQYPLPVDRQLTNDEISALYKARRYDDIEAARQRGQLDNILNSDNEGN